MTSVCFSLKEEQRMELDGDQRGIDPYEFRRINDCFLNLDRSNLYEIV